MKANNGPDQRDLGNAVKLRMKPSLLFVAGHLPAQNGTQAGMKVSYHLCRVLARHYDIHLLCFVTADEMRYFRPGGSAVFASQEIMPVDNRLRAIGAFSAPTLPLSISARHSRGFLRRVIKLKESHDFSVAILDHTAVWQYAEVLAGIPSVCGISHDVLSQSWQRRAERATGVASLLLHFEMRRIRRWEASALNHLMIAVPLSGKDATLLSSLNPDVCVHPIQPWFCDLSPEVGARTHKIRPSTNLLFWGALNRAENQDCVQFIVDEILPVVRKHVPDVHFCIAGVASDAQKSAWNAPGVTVTGFVEDVGALFAQMDIALLPLRLGAGIKIKVLESMSAGLAVVTTPVGIEGIPAREGTDYLLGNSAQELANHVIALLSNVDFREAMGRHAHDFIKAEFDFDASAERFAGALISRPR